MQTNFDKLYSEDQKFLIYCGAEPVFKEQEIDPKLKGNARTLAKKKEEERIANLTKEFYEWKATQLTKTFGSIHKTFSYLKAHKNLVLGINSEELKTKVSTKLEQLIETQRKTEKTFWWIARFFERANNFLSGKGYRMDSEWAECIRKEVMDKFTGKIDKKEMKRLCSLINLSEESRRILLKAVKALSVQEVTDYVKEGVWAHAQSFHGLFLFSGVDIATIFSALETDEKKDAFVKTCLSTGRTSVITDLLSRISVKDRNPAARPTERNEELSQFVRRLHLALYFSLVGETEQTDNPTHIEMAILLYLNSVKNGSAENLEIAKNFLGNCSQRTLWEINSKDYALEILTKEEIEEFKQNYDVPTEQPIELPTLWG